MPDERDLTLRVKTEGYQEATDAEQKLAEAEGKTTEALKEKAQAADQAKPAGTGEDDAKRIKDTAEETENLAVAEQDLKDVLNQIHPAFGGLLDAMGGALNLSGQLGAKQIDLGKIIARVTDHVKSNADAYKLLAAGSAAVGAIMLMIAIWQKLREEIEAANAAIKKHAALTTELRGEEEQRRAALVEAMSKRGVTGPQEIETGRKQEELLRRFALFDDATAAATAAALEGKPVDAETLRRMAAGVKAGAIEPTAPDFAGRFAAMEADAGMRKSLDDAAATAQTEMRRVFQEALHEITTAETARGFFGMSVVDPGSREMFRRAVETLGGAGGADPNELFQQAQKIWLDLQARRAGEPEPFGEMRPSIGDRYWRGGIDPQAQQAMQTLLQIMSMAGQSPEPDVLNELGEFAPEDVPMITGPFGLGDRLRRPGASTTVIHHHHNHYNERNYSTGAGIRGGRNGRNFRERTGIG